MNARQTTDIQITEDRQLSELSEPSEPSNKGKDEHN